MSRPPRPVPIPMQCAYRPSSLGTGRHCAGLGNSVRLVIDTLKQARRKEKDTEGLLLHSDHLVPSTRLGGYQYTSKQYALLTRAYHITPSMSRRGNCWDNAPMENFFGHLKAEALRHIRVPSFERASELIDQYIEFYNYERIQLKTKQTPYQIRCLSG